MGNLDLEMDKESPDTEASLAVEISSEFLSSICPAGVASGDQSEDVSGPLDSIFASSGSLTTCNSLNARAVATLLRYIIGQRRPPASSVFVLGSDLGAIGKGQILKLRRRIGVVGGDYSLLGDLSVAQNLALPCMVRKLGRRQIQLRIERISDALKLDDLLDEPVSHLGAIERRVALIARALTHDPELVILEAPLSGLDDNWSAIIVEHLKKLAITGSTALLFHEYTGAFNKTS